MKQPSAVAIGVLTALLEQHGKGEHRLTQAGRRRLVEIEKIADDRDLWNRHMEDAGRAVSQAEWEETSDIARLRALLTATIAEWWSGPGLTE